MTQWRPAKGKAEIDAEIERILPAFERGGYIPHVDHWVPPEVPLDNYTYYLSRLGCLVLQTATGDQPGADSVDGAGQVIKSATATVYRKTPGAVSGSE